MTLVQAQERTYSGTVKSADDGQVIIGANVSVVGTTQGTSTGADGTYSIKARVGAQLTFSYLGMQSQTVTVGNTTTINVTLQSDATDLENVVVVAYGTTKKKDLTGSVATVDSRAIATQSNSSLSKVLEGAIPGVQVSSVDGQPGMDMAIRIRGLGTANQNNSNPLIVVDGVSYNNADKNILTTIDPKDVESMNVLKDAASTALYGSRGANGVIVVTTKKGKQGKAKVTFDGKWGINMASTTANLNQMTDPQDIYEWAWKSIYNSVRYGNFEGTKYTTNVQNPNMSHDDAALFASQHLFNYKGDKNSFAGPNDLGNYLAYSVPGLAEGLQYTGDQSGTDWSATMNGTYLVNPDGKLNPNASLLYNDDWQDHFFQKKLRQEYNVSVSGATEKTNYYFSAGYLEDPSYIMGSSYNRYNLRSNINTQITKWLGAGVNVAYSRRAVQSPATRWGRNAGDVSENIFYWLQGNNALAPIYAYDKNGNIRTDDAASSGVNDYTGDVYSPVGPTLPPLGANYYDPIKMLTLDKDERINQDINVNGYLEAKFLKDFTFRAAMAVDNTTQMRSRYRNNETGRYRTSGGSFGRNYWDYMNVNSLQTLSWSHDYGKHHIDALAGHEYTWVRTSGLNYRSSQGLIPGFNTFANFIALNTDAAAQSAMSGNGGTEDREALEGYFLRANYVFDNRYLFSASIRGDGSSKFRHVADRWGAFWSVGGAWRISQEEWAKNSWLSDLKLRADYGVTGNQNGVGNYSGYQTWSYGSTGWLNSGNSMPSGWSLNQGAAVDQHLTWEKIKAVDVGLDFRLWDRFYGSLDWYQRNTDDMLWATPMSWEMGQNSITRNSAGMRTRGFEFELGVDILKTKDFFWSFSVNGTHYKSVLTKVPAGTATNPDLNGCWTAAPDAWSPAGLGSGSGTFYLRGIDKPYYNIYMVKYMGVDQNSGLPLYSHYVTEAEAAAGTYGQAKKGDLVGTVVAEDASYVEIGDATPDFMGGFSTYFKWKNLDLSAQFAFQIGGKFFSAVYGYDGLYNSQKIGAPVSMDMAGNTWTPENKGAKFPMQMYANPTGTSWYNSGIAWGGSWQYTDMSLFDASYLSVKNITVGYNFPQKWMDKVGIGGIRAYVSLDNMWVITSQAGIDPRMALDGGWSIGRGTYPYMRTCSLGINVTF